MASKKDKPIRYFEQFYQIWDEYFWMTPEKGCVSLSVGSKREQNIGFGDHPIDPK